MNDDELTQRNMKFIMCKSEGGPYDDASFIAGFYCGVVDRALLSNPRFASQAWLPTEILPQIDLIAMRHDYLTQIIQQDYSGYSLILFTPSH